MVLRVGLYTNNRAKIEGVYRAFEEVYRDVELVTSGSGLVLKDQPVSLDEMVEGAVARARHMIHNFDVDYGVGVEAGVSPLGLYGVYIVLQVAAVTRDGIGFGLGGSSAYFIDHRLGSRIVSSSMARVLESITGDPSLRESKGFIGYLTRGRVDRTVLTFEATRNALHTLLNGHVFKIPSKDL